MASSENGGSRKRPLPSGMALGRPLWHEIQPDKMGRLKPKFPDSYPGDNSQRYLPQNINDSVIADKDVRSALQPHKPGQVVKLEIQRAGKPVALTLELGALPQMD